ncbi:MAG: hypothetical protein R3D60_03765 [Paracoccaceae bacterium]
MRAPRVVRDARTSGSADRWVDRGWIEVDRETLRHVRYPNVFGMGDIAGVPKRQDGRQRQIPPAGGRGSSGVRNRAGREGRKVFSGYTSCPMISGSVARC